MAGASEPLPDHVDESIEAIARLHANHHRRSSHLQNVVNFTVACAGRPASLVIIACLVAGWIAGNMAVRHLGYRPADGPPFQWLELVCSLIALFMTILILITQRHDNELDEHRQQLILDLCILNDQKAAKMIELLEALRQDSPQLGARVDAKATAMAKPADTESILAAIKEASQ